MLTKAKPRGAAAGDRDSALVNYLRSIERDDTIPRDDAACVSDVMQLRQLLDRAGAWEEVDRQAAEDLLARYAPDLDPRHTAKAARKLAKGETANHRHVVKEVASTGKVAAADLPLVEALKAIDRGELSVRDARKLDNLIEGAAEWDLLGGREQARQFVAKHGMLKLIDSNSSDVDNSTAELDTNSPPGEGTSSLPTDSQLIVLLNDLLREKLARDTRAEVNQLIALVNDWTSYNRHRAHELILVYAPHFLKRLERHKPSGEEEPRTNGHAKKGKRKAADDSNDTTDPFKPAEQRDFGGKTLSRVKLANLVRHPANRHPTREAVNEIASSLKTEGLLEPIVVRPLAGSLSLQILSGETRVLAAVQLGWKEIDAHVIRCSDARALELLAIYNSKRQDLTPIDKAKLIETLCKSEAEGGGGLTREKAASAVGLESGSAASNLVRLLELPEAWQKRVASGELPQRVARAVIPVVHCKPVMAALEKKWKGWNSYEDAERSVNFAIRREVRALDEEHYFQTDKLPPGASHYHKCLFRKDDALIAELQPIVIERPTGKKGETKPVTYVQDVKRYETLMIKAIREKWEKEQSRAKGKGKQAAKKSPAELRREKERKEQLQKLKIEAFRHAWIRELIAAKIDVVEVNGHASEQLDLWLAAERFVLWLSTSPIDGYSNRTEFAADVALAAAAGVDAGEQMPEDAWRAAKAITEFGTVMRRMVATLLRRQPKDPQFQIVPLYVVEDLAREVKVDIVQAWRDGQAFDRSDLRRMTEGDDGPAHRQLLRDYLALFDREGINAQAEEWGVEIPSVTRKAAIDYLAVQARTWPLPKAIAPLKAAKADKHAKKGGKR